MVNNPDQKMRQGIKKDQPQLNASADKSVANNENEIIRGVDAIAKILELPYICLLAHKRRYGLLIYLEDNIWCGKKSDILAFKEFLEKQRKP
jgi:hypothetical protein